MIAGLLMGLLKLVAYGVGTTATWYGSDYLMRKYLGEGAWPNNIGAEIERENRFAQQQAASMLKKRLQTEQEAQDVIDFEEQTLMNQVGMGGLVGPTEGMPETFFSAMPELNGMPQGDPSINVMVDRMHDRMLAAGRQPTIFDALGVTVPQEGVPNTLEGGIDLSLMLGGGGGQGGPVPSESQVQ